MTIKIILVACFILFTLYLVTIKNSAHIRAWRKIALLGFVAFAIFTILFPNTTTDIAELVGVGRGADLLLYAMSVAVIFLAIHSYVKSRQTEQLFVKLARKIALMEAEKTRETKIDDK